MYVWGKVIKKMWISTWICHKNTIFSHKTRKTSFLADDTQEGGRRKERGNPGRRIQVKVW